MVRKESLQNIFQMFKMKQKEGKNEEWKVCGISRKYPTYRNYGIVSVTSWLKGKRKDDEAEGLWRIHDALYDFTEFIPNHPGGAFWLEQTKGTDITESFETHHFSALPGQMLSKYRVRQAAQPRNCTLTFHENGFYNTLKKRIREKLPDLDYRPRQRTHLMHLNLLLGTFLFALGYAATGYIIFQLLAAVSLAWLGNASHNYVHQKNNWQMYTFNLTLLNVNTWRISHVISHHMYTNSLHDLEMSMFEPFLNWVPNGHLASKPHRLTFAVLQPIIYSAIYPMQFVSRLIQSIATTNVMYWHDVIPFTLPALMFTVSSATLFTVLLQWYSIITLSSFIFGLIGLNAAHHHPEIYHDGDAPRADRDWGLYQMDTVMDKIGVQKSHFLGLTHFGEHALHHLFPTLDHGILHQLQPVLLETLPEFKGEFRECSQWDHIIGQNKQLLRTEPNPVPPGIKIK